MEIEGIKYSEVRSMDLMDMEAVLKQNPWFSYLREILLEKLYRKDKEAFAQTLSQTAVFLSSRKTLYDRINSPEEEGISEDIPKETSVETKESVQTVQRPRVIVAGGDFFSKEDLKTIDPEEDMELKLKSSPFYRPAPEPASEPAEKPQAPKQKERRGSLLREDGTVNFDDLAFCTETLGHIYAQQGFYDKAIEVFSKLILLYPQKSAYFAALVNEMKKNTD
ncbi:MAG: tetratricopeptide repeat protein [Bacteroidales bacterium]|nr:tetratricopeptide repeat protein [Bacteroidales bacterium]